MILICIYRLSCLWLSCQIGQKSKKGIKLIQMCLEIIWEPSDFPWSVIISRMWYEYCKYISQPLYYWFPYKYTFDPGLCPVDKITKKPHLLFCGYLKTPRTATSLMTNVQYESHAADPCLLIKSCRSKCTKGTLLPRPLQISTVQSNVLSGCQKEANTWEEF